MNDLERADEALLDVHRPTGEGEWPVATLVPGRGGTNDDGAFAGEVIVAEEAVVHVPTVSSELPFPEQIEEVACAVRSARATAEEYGGDPDPVTLIGYSQAATTGVIAGLSDQVDDDRCVAAEASAVPDAVIGFEGPHDLATPTQTSTSCSSWRRGRHRAPGGVVVWHGTTSIALLGAPVGRSVRVAGGERGGRTPLVARGVGCAWWSREEVCDGEWSC